MPLRYFKHGKDTDRPLIASLPEEYVKAAKKEIKTGKPMSEILPLKHWDALANCYESTLANMYARKGYLCTLSDRVISLKESARKIAREQMS